MGELRDYQFEKAAAFDHTYRDALEKINPNLRGVADAFIENIERVRATAELPALLIFFSMLYQQCADKAINDFSKTCEQRDDILHDFPIFLKPGSEIYKYVKDEITRSFGRGITQLLPDPKKINITVSGHSDLHIQVYSTSVDPINIGLNSILNGMIVGACTAFETLAGDLWETAVNERPSILSKLKGRKKRPKIDADSEEEVEPKESIITKTHSQAGYESKKLDLDILHVYGYDLRKNMGTLLRDRYDFDTINEVTLAYQQAFSKDFTKIDEAIADKDSLVFLTSKIRNLIVHKAGIVDKKFLQSTKKARKKTSLFLDAENGKHIIIDGNTASKIIDKIIRLCVDLLLSIDEWLISHPGKEDE